MCGRLRCQRSGDRLPPINGSRFLSIAGWTWPSNIQNSRRSYPRTKAGNRTRYSEVIYIHRVEHLITRLALYLSYGLPHTSFLTASLYNKPNKSAGHIHDTIQLSQEIESRSALLRLCHVLKRTLERSWKS